MDVHTEAIRNCPAGHTDAAILARKQKRRLFRPREPDESEYLCGNEDRKARKPVPAENREILIERPAHIDFEDRDSGNAEKSEYRCPHTEPPYCCEEPF